MARLTVIPGGRSTVERFEALIGRHYQLLYRTAYRFTRSVHDAEDLVQEVCARAYARLDEVEQLDQPHSWLLCVMRRIFIDQLRRFDRSHVESLDVHDAATFAADGPEPPEQTEAALWRCGPGGSTEHGGTSTRISARSSRCMTSRGTRSQS